MAPTRLASRGLAGIKENSNSLISNGVNTRSKQTHNLKSTQAFGKRKADSPLKDSAVSKRAAFGDITNAVNNVNLSIKDRNNVKKVVIEAKVFPSVKSVKQPTQGKPVIQVNGLHHNELIGKQANQTLTKQTTVSNGKQSKTKQLQKAANIAFATVQKHLSRDHKQSVTTRAQNGILKTDKHNSSQKSQNNSTKSAKSDESDPSLYVSALDHISPVDKEVCKNISEKLDKVVLEDNNKSLLDESQAGHTVPDNVEDFDKENWNDPFQVSHYAMDIFNYLKRREPDFAIDDYLKRQKGITSWMRALLVDWMVEVQESFELNHETLYLAVKLVDLYLCRTTKPMEKDELQLLGATSIFIASKFDERIPPLVDDFLYICDGAYTHGQLIEIEKTILKAVDFNLSMPLSYRFLRRYARCARVSMPTLTLARFVLELCLLDYALVTIPDSKMAAGALFLALQMKDLGGWTPTLQFYSGYKLEEIQPIAIAQNGVLHKKPKEAIMTVRNKYSHKIFFEVAKIPLIDNSVLSS